MNSPSTSAPSSTPAVRPSASQVRRLPGRRSQRQAVLNFMALMLILLVATGLRFYQLGGQSLWSDEGNSAVMATRSLAQIASAAANDIHPPLYYWLLRLWAGMAGLSEAGLRSLSAVLGILLVWAVAELGRRLYNPITGLVSGLIAALAPFQIYYSQEARMYILMAFLATLSVLAFWWYVYFERRELTGEARPSPNRRALWVLVAGSLVVSWTAGLYTHYAFPLMIALLTLLYLGWVWRSRQDWRRRLLRWALLLGITLLLFGPWLPTAIRQLTRWPSSTPAMTPGTALQTACNVLGLGPLARYHTGAWWTWLLPALALIGAVPWPSDRQRPLLLSWFIPIAWVIAALAMMLALGLFRDAYLKFLLIASPAYCLLLARGILVPAGELQASLPTASETTDLPPIRSWPPEHRAAQPRGLLAAAWLTFTLAMVAGLSGLATSRYFGDPAVARDDYRGIAQFIITTSQPNDAILLDAPGQIEVFRYYYHGELPIYALPRQRPLDPEATLQELNQLLNRDKVYALYWATAEADPAGLIEHWMNSWGYKTLDQWRGNVRLAVYVMPERRLPDEIVDGLDLSLGNEITLLGYRGWNLTPTAGQVTQLQLLWRADRQPSRRYKVFLQLLDERQQVIAQRDAEPVGDSRPTDSWQPGEVVVDNHGLLIPPGTPPGTYQRIIGLYDLETLERLRLPDGSDFISLPPLTVTRAKTPPLLAAFNMQYTQSFDFGGITLLGHDRYKRGFGHLPRAPLYPGDLLHLTFYWRANVSPRADWWFDLRLTDEDGQVVASLQAPLVAETYPTTLWERGDIVRGEHDLLLPGDLPAGTYRLTLILLPDTDTVAGEAYLGTVKVSKPSE